MDRDPFSKKKPWTYGQIRGKIIDWSRNNKKTLLFWRFAPHSWRIARPTLVGFYKITPYRAAIKILKDIILKRKF